MSTRLAENRSHGRKAILFARKHIKESSTYRQHIGAPGGEELHAKIVEMYNSPLPKNKIVNLLYSIPVLTESPVYFRTKKQRVKNHFKLFGEKIGNCDHYASFVYRYFAKYAKDRRIEYVRMRHLNDEETVPRHLFVVVDRAPNSHLNEPDTWGKDAIVIDAWDNKLILGNRKALEKNFFQGWDNQYKQDKYVLTTDWQYKPDEDLDITSNLTFAIKYCQLLERFTHRDEYQSKTDIVEIRAQLNQAIANYEAWVLHGKPDNEANSSLSDINKMIKETIAKLKIDDQTDKLLALQWVKDIFPLFDDKKIISITSNLIHFANEDILTQALDTLHATHSDTFYKNLFPILMACAQRNMNACLKNLFDMVKTEQDISVYISFDFIECLKENNNLAILDPNLIEKVSTKELFAAVAAKDCEKTKTLLQLGADPLYTDANNLSNIAHAASQESKELMEVVCKALSQNKKLDIQQVCEQLLTAVNMLIAKENMEVTHTIFNFLLDPPVELSTPLISTIEESFKKYVELMDKLDWFPSLS